MIANLKTYPVMKGSGVKWLGEIPEHWDLVPNRAVMRLKKEVVGSRSDGYVLLSLTKQGIIARDMENPEGKFPSSFETYQVVEPGDLIFCLFDIDETPRAVGLSSLYGMITGAYTRFVCTDSRVREFVYLLYLSLDNGKLLKPLYSGLRKVIQKTTFLSAKLPLPPLPEQKAIVRFIDYVDRRIRRYIRAKRKLINLLEEQKQVIIHRAVTRGLNPDVPLRDSGVEWLGQVPTHWEVRRLKTLFREVDHRTTSGTEKLLSLRMYAGLVPHQDVSNKPITPNELVGYKKVAPGQLVMNRMRAAIGIFGVPKCEGLVSPDYAIFECRHALELSYFLLLLKTSAMCAEFRLASKGLGTGSSGFMRLYTDQFGTIWVPFPPCEEQAAIVEHLDEATGNTDIAITRANLEIELLNEYRARLIADVVAGKLDVRETAASLPDESEEAEAINDLLPELDETELDEPAEIECDV